jgi:MerR family transcriptional regulator, light-induced transcriptional regulator
VLCAPQHEPRCAATRCTTLTDSPAPGHPQVTTQHKPTLEAEEEVLPDSFHRLEPASVELLDDPFRRGPRVRRLHFDTLAGEHLEPGRSSVKRVAFGHAPMMQCGACVVTPGLNIAALAQRTGVAPDTLRKWEQRYGILQPERTSGGQRRYSERDVARVEWLRARLGEGYRIGEAAQLLGNTDVAAARTPREHVDAILAATARDDVGEIGVRLDQSFALHPLDSVLTDVIEPLLHEVGRRWQTGELSVAQEHLVSASVRARLGHLVGDAGGGVRGSVVLACAPNERHELGLMTLAIALRNDGWQVAYVGADTPLTDAFALAQRLSASMLGISLALKERAPELEAELEQTGRPDGVEFVLGGAGATRELAERVRGRYIDGDLHEAVSELRAILH